MFKRLFLALVLMSLMISPVYATTTTNNETSIRSLMVQVQQLMNILQRLLNQQQLSESNSVTAVGGTLLKVHNQKGWVINNYPSYFDITWNYTGPDKISEVYLVNKEGKTCFLGHPSVKDNKLTSVFVKGSRCYSGSIDSVVSGSYKIVVATEGWDENKGIKASSNWFNVTVLDEGVTNLISTNWGYSFVKDVSWEMVSKTDSKIVLRQTLGENKGDVITLTYSPGNIIQDSDSKFGNVSYLYDQASKSDVNSKGWFTCGQRIGQRACDDPAKSIKYISGEIPVFLGVGRWLTYIVPKSINGGGFIKMNISGSGDTSSLEKLLNTFTKDRG